MFRSAEPYGRIHAMLGAAVLCGAVALASASAATADETTPPVSGEPSSPPTVGGPVNTAPILDITLPVRDLTTPVQDLTLITTNDERSVTDSVGAEEHTVTLAADVLFTFDESALGSDAEEVLAEAAEILRSDAVGTTVRIDGYTDAKGSEDYNQALSEERAQAVEAELAALLTDVDVTFETAGHGSADPVEPNTLDGEDNPDGRAKNRRVEVSFPR